MNTFILSLQKNIYFICLYSIFILILIQPLIYYNLLSFTIHILYLVCIHNLKLNILLLYFLKLYLSLLIIHTLLLHLQAAVNSIIYSYSFVINIKLSQMTKHLYYNLKYSILKIKDL